MLKHLSCCLFVGLIILSGPQKPDAQPTQANRRTEVKQPNSQPSVTPLNNSATEINNPANTASPSQYQNGNPKDDPFKVEQLRQNRIIVRATVWIAIFSGLSFLAVAAYAITAYKQWKAIEKQANHASEQVEAMAGQQEVMREQVQVMRDTLTQNLDSFQTGERAYVAISKIQFGTPLLPGRMPAINFHFTNGGRTPAWNVRISATFSVEDDTSDQSHGFVETASHTVEKEIALMMLPGVTRDPIAINAGFTVTDNLRVEVEGGMSTFFVRGIIYFNDISTQEQTFPFCFIYHWITGFQDCKRENPNGERSKQVDP
jgi:hypothetical protein